MEEDSKPTDEKYPLLLFVSEDENKKTSRVNSRGRFKNIAIGATSVINQWPDHLTACWLTTLFISFCFCFLGIFVIALSLRGGIHLHPYCNKTRLANGKGNVSVHLFHDSLPWCPDEMGILEQVVKTYPDWDIELVIIKNINQHEDDNVDTKTKPLPQTNNNKRSSSINDTKQPKTNEDGEANERLSKKTKRNDSFEKYINVDFDNLLRTVFRLGQRAERDVGTRIYRSPYKTINELLQHYPCIRVVNTTFEDIFQKTPLYFTWQNLNMATKMFAARVIHLWDEAGISFELPELLNEDPFGNAHTKPCMTSSYKNSLVNPVISDYARKIDLVKKFVRKGKTSFQNMPDGVIMIDQEGLHMETKTSCHAFLGELISRLTRATKEQKPKDIVTKSLKKFCVRGGVQSPYCTF